MAKKGAKGSKADTGSELWEEIQKLGGDQEDLDMLRDVDTGGPSAASKPGKIDESVLQGDLSELVKSLGLATSVPEFINTAEGKESAGKNKREKKAQKPEKVEKSEKSDKSKKAEKADKSDKTEKLPKKAEKLSKKAEKAERSKKAKESEAAADEKADEMAEEEEEAIPGFKIKSAKDAQPLSKATRLAIEPNPQWYSIELPLLETDETTARPSEDEVVRKLEYAEQLLDSENEMYEKRGLRQKSLSTSDKSFVSSILTSGTLSDRVSALTLIVQESPVHNMKALGQLMQMVQKKNRREALLAVGSVKDLMATSLLPGTRKLRHFADQPIHAANATDAHLILWAYEDRLKRSYFDLIQVMEAMSYDPVVHTRQNMVTYFEDLLEQKPEQEHNLLRLLVNKLGDKERQLAAKASYLVLKLLNVHPNMKHVVVRTVQELLLSKAATKERAQYYTMITLNQIILSSRDVQTANLMLEVYFAFFKRLLKAAQDEEDAEADEEGTKPSTPAKGKGKGKGKDKVYIGQKAMKKAKADAEKLRAEEERSMGNKLMVAVLTGLNRALPFAQMADAQMDAHVGTVFQIAHAGNFNTVVQSLVLLHQIARVRPAIGDRFYRTLYDSLLDPRLDQTSKKAMYLNVLFRALKSDTSAPRVMAFAKRIMQVCLHSQAEFASGALFVVSQVFELNPQMYAMLSQPEDSDAPAYDSTKRDPQFAHAESSCLWEATMLARHFHPSVTHTIQQIAARQPVPPINNLHNHSLAHFLDRFVFRKPKSSDDAQQPVTLRGQSLMQPLIQADAASYNRQSAISAGEHILASKRVGAVAGGLDLTSEAIADMQKSDMRPDEQFFHQFFQTKRQRMGKKAKNKKRAGGDDNDGEDEDVDFADDNTGFAGAVKEGEDLDEDEVWKAMTASMPDVAGDGIDEDEDDDDDLLAALREGEDSDDDDEGDDDDDSESGSGSDDDGFADFDDEIGAGSDDDEEEAATGTKRKGADSDKQSKRKKKEKIPMFGSLDDYAHLIDSTEGLE